jgi:CRISPR-associated protein Csb2
VLPRHLKLKGEERSNPDLQEAARTRELINIVRRELMNRQQFRQLHDSVDIEPMLSGSAGTLLGGTNTPWLKFGRMRANGGGSVAAAKGYGFRLTFREPVSGPVALGYGCHFGLGQFVPEDFAE